MTRTFDRTLQAEARIGTPLIAASDDLEGGRERSYAIHLLTERFASLRFTTRTEAGTSTPPSIVTVNIDMRTGRSVPLDGILDVRRDGFAEAIAKGIGDQAQNAGYFRTNLAAVASGEDSAWSFAEDKAIVTWQPAAAHRRKRWRSPLPSCTLPQAGIAMAAEKRRSDRSTTPALKSGPERPLDRHQV